MKRAGMKFGVLGLAGLLALQTPLVSLAAEPESWAWEDELLTGTGWEEEDEFIAGIEAASLDLLNSEADGEALVKVQRFLRKTVTNPVVDSIDGEWAVLAMARAGNLSESARDAYLTNLFQKLEETEGVLHSRKLTEYSRVTLALSSIGVNAADIFGYNLLAPLSDLDAVVWQGMNGPIWALIALDSRGYEIPKAAEGKTQTTRDNLLSYILRHQLEDGGWSLQTDGTTAELDITAMALQALVPYQDREEVQTAIEKGTEKLRKMGTKNGDGADWSGLANVEGAVQILTAFSALDTGLVNQSLLDALVSFQLEDGSFEHVRGEGSDGMATEQAAYGLAAWNRAVSVQNRLYDMTDVDAFEPETPEKPEDSEIAEKLEKGIIPKEIFASINADRENYRYEGEGYSILLKGKNTYAPRDMHAGLDITYGRKSLTFTTEEDTALPGRVEFNIGCDLGDGVYMLYGKDGDKLKKIEWCSVFDGEAVCEIAEGGTYVLKQLETEEKDASGVKDIQTVAEDAEKKPMATTTKKTTTKTVSNTVKAQIKNGIVEKKQFESIADTDKNLKIEGKLLIDGVYNEDYPYILTINGKDVKRAKDLKAGLREGSLYEKDILKLAEEPYIFRFEEEGAFPGKMQVQLSADLEDGEYLLLHYDEENRRAEYIQKVKAEDGEVRFIVSEGGTYFLAKRAKTKSLTELEEEAEAAVLEGTGFDDGELLTGTGSAWNGGSFLLPCILGGTANLGLAGVWTYRHMKKKEEQEEEEADHEKDK